MFTSLIIMQSLDGFIAKNLEDDLSWGSKEDKNFFRQKTKEIGAMIMGSKTFESMPKMAFKNRFSIVLTRNPEKYNGIKEAGYPSEIIFIRSQIDLIQQELKSRNFESVALIGGGFVNRFFLENNLVNEIFITIAPKLFLSGVGGFNQFSNSELLPNSPKLFKEINLQLLNHSLITSNELLLHYKVILN